MEQGLGKLCELHDIAGQLNRNVRNSWAIILSLNLSCITGVFTLGFGIGASVVTNNVAGLLALANGLLPMRKVAQIEAERRHIREIELQRGRFVHEENSDEPLIEPNTGIPPALNETEFGEGGDAQFYRPAAD